MSRSTTDYLRHILDEAVFLGAHAGSVASDEFLSDETLKRAVERSIEIIGEAAKHVPEDFRQLHPQVPW